MFKDSPEGQTHSQNDGCGMPEHNSMPIEQSKCCELCWKEYVSPSRSHCINNDCPCHTPASPKSAEWEREFDDLLTDLIRVWIGVAPVKYTKEEAREEVYKFISSLLLQQEQKFVEEKRGMIDFIPEMLEPNSDSGWHDTDGLKDSLRKQFLP